MTKIISFLLILVVIQVALCGQLEDVNFQQKYQLKVRQRGSFSEYPQKGDTVKVHYTGRLLNGKEFDSSKNRGQPFSFQVGVGQVIQCWDEVIQALTLGDQVTVICPSNLAYGSRGAGGVIPANADLEFDIDMLGFGKYKIEDL